MRAAVRAALGVPAGTVVIVLAARLEVGKGHHLLLEALAGLPRGSWQAWIAGGVQQPSEQPYLEALRRKADAAGIADSVLFLGQRDDIPALLAAADVYCQPNQSPDSFGLSFVEALAAGLPVITTRLGAAPEIVDESCGVLVEPASASALADALRHTLGDGDARRQMSAAARVRSRDFCDLSRSLSKLATDLQRAVSAAPVLT